MPDLAAPSLQHICLPAALSPTEFSGELPPHARGTPALRFEEVAQAGFCTGAPSQAVRKVVLTCPAPAGGAVGTSGSRRWEWWSSTHEGSGWNLGEIRAGEILAPLKSVSALPALPSSMHRSGFFSSYAIKENSVWTMVGCLHHTLFSACVKLRSPCLPCCGVASYG